MAQDNYDNDLDLSAQDNDLDTDFGASDRPKNKTTLLVALLCVVLLAGGGFAAYELFFSAPSMPAPSAPLPYTPPVPPVAEATPPTPTDPSLPAGITPTADVATALPPPDTAVASTNTTVPAALTPITVGDGTVPSVATPTAPVTVQNPETVPPIIDAPATTADIAPAGSVTAEVAPAPADVPAPPANQLKPIDPNAVVAKAENKPMSANKAAATIDQVNAILAETEVSASATSTNPATAATQNTLAKQVEVTPRAQQVIIVKKTYGAQSSRAINAAGERVLDAGQYGDAVEIYNKQLRNNPSDPLALAGKALALQKAGRDAEAMNVYQRLLDLNPRDIEAMTNYLGLLQKQDPSQAMNRLNSLSQQYPDNAAVAGQMGMIHASMMDTPNAIRDFQKAAALDPQNATYPFNMAVLYDRLGTKDKAREAYNNALQLALDYPSKAIGMSAETIRERLRNLSGS